MPSHRSDSPPRARRFAASALLVALALTVAPAAHSGSLLGGTVGAVIDVTTGLVAALPIKVPGLAIPSKARATIDGAVGGVVQCGRVRVVVPPGAFYGKADVSVYVPDGTTLACDLSISPASANGFAVPVRLELDATGTNVAGGLFTGYFDPALGKWTRVPASWEDPRTHTVHASLWHFSRYGAIPGRAGW